MRRWVSFIIASFPLVCLPPYKHLQSGTEKIKREPAKKIKEREATPTGPEGTRSCTPTSVTCGKMKENVIVINVPPVAVKEI